MPSYELNILVKGTDRASGAFRSAGSALQRMGEIAGGILGARLFMRIGQEISDAASSVVNFASESVWSAARVEEMNAVLLTLARNAGVAEDSVMEAVQAIKGEGIETKVAQKAVAQFTRYSLDMAKAQDLAKVAQNAAVIAMQDSSQALEGLIHGITTMNVRVLRTYGITLTSTIEAQKKYAESIGKTTAELTNEEKINAVLNAVLDEGYKIRGAYDAAMETAGKKQRSLARYIEETRILLGGPYQKVLARIVDMKTDFWKTMQKLAEEGQPLNRIMKAMARIIGSLLGKAFAWGEEKGEGFANILESVADWIEKLADRVEALEFPSIFEMFQRLGATVKWLVDTFKPIFDILSALAKYFLFIIRDGDSANDWLTHLPEEWRGPIKAVGDLVSNMRDTILTAWEAVRTWVDDNWPAIKEKILTVWQAISTWVGENWPGIRDKILEVWGGIKAWFETDGASIWDRVLEIFNTVKDWVVTNWPIIQGVILTAWEVIKANIQSAVAIIWPALQQLIESFKSLFTPERIQLFLKVLGALAVGAGALLQAVFGVVVGIIAGILKAASTFIQVIYRVIEALSGIIDGFKMILEGDLLGGIMKILHSLAEGLWTALIGLGVTIVDLLAGVFENIMQFFVDLWHRLTGGSIIQDIFQDIIDVIIGFIPAVLDAGKQFIQGLWDGMKQIWTNLTGWVEEKVTGVIDTFKGLFGIESPSKVMAGIGQNLMRGLAEGISEATLAPVQTMGAMAPAVMGAMGGGQTFSRETINNYNLTIHSRARQEDVRASFDMMKALGGGGT